jgi:hypothetical protein
MPDATHVTVPLGGNVTCTINNNDIAPVLTLDKIVVNDNGGTAAESAWALTANGGAAGILTGSGAASHPDVSSGAGFKAGTYALSESSVTVTSGYTASNWSCVKNGGAAISGASITLALGDSAACTITNDDQPGTIIIKKVTDPLNAPGTFMFVTNPAGTPPTGWSDFTLASGAQKSVTLNPGTYSVREDLGLGSGFVLTGVGSPGSGNCAVTGSGGSTGTGDLPTATATITLKAGDTVTCTFENTATGSNVTRTQGFWATHPQLAQIAWFGGTGFGHTFPGVASVTGIGDITLCGRPLDTLGKVMGAFWSDISKTTTGAKRSALDQARMQLLQQLIAAELNASAFNSTPSVGSFSAWEAAYCGTNQNAIKTAQQQAASFNTAGDSGQFTPGTSADSKGARAIADLIFWNILP